MKTGGSNTLGAKEDGPVKPDGKKLVETVIHAE